MKLHILLLCKQLSTDGLVYVENVFKIKKMGLVNSHTETVTEISVLDTLCTDCKAHSVIQSETEHIGSCSEFRARSSRS